MAHNNGVISAPVDIRGDIAAVLGVQSGDLAELCQNANVNRWSAHKPVEHNDPWNTTNQKFAELDYGLSIGVKTVSQIISDHSDFCWTYTKPSTWFRVMDFDGYNHNAAGPDLYLHTYPVYTNIQSGRMSIMVTFYNDADEIPILGIPVKTTTQSGAPSEELSDWHLVFILYKGQNTPSLFNTDHPLSYFNPGQTIDIDGYISGSDLGATVTIVPALAYPNNQMTPGLHSLAGGFMNQYNLVPLSFTSAMEAEMSVTVSSFEYLPGMTIGHSQIIDPSTGSNTYKFSSVGVVAQGNNTGGNTCNFTLKLGLRRTVNGVTTIYYSISVNTQSITTTSSSAPYAWYFAVAPNGYLNFSPSFKRGESDYTTAQSGDVLFLEASYENGLQTATVNVKTIS